MYLINLLLKDNSVEYLGAGKQPLFGSLEINTCRDFEGLSGLITGLVVCVDERGISGVLDWLSEQKKLATIPVFFITKNSSDLIAKAMSVSVAGDYWVGKPDWDQISLRTDLLLKTAKLRCKSSDINDLSKDFDHAAKLDKLLTVGEMAAGVVHELNRPLTLIHGNVARIKKHCTGASVLDEEKLIKALDKAKLGVDRCVALSRSLINFVRNSRGDSYRKVSLEGLIGDVQILCGIKLYTAKIEFVAPSAESLVDEFIEARASEVAQILINLVSNASDALMELNISSPWIRLEVQPSQDSVEFRVSDAGNGIPEEILPSIFESFFTTKGVGLGTGLGLSLSKRIAEEHGGSLVIDIEHPNTCFVLTLPRIQK